MYHRSGVLPWVGVLACDFVFNWTQGLCFFGFEMKIYLGFFRLHIEKSAMMIARDGRKRCNFEFEFKVHDKFQFYLRKQKLKEKFFIKRF